MTDLLDTWKKTCAVLADTLSEDIYERWISVITPLGQKDGVFTLGVSNDFYVCWLEENYLPLVVQAVASVTGSTPKITFVVDHQQAAPANADPVREKPRDDHSAPRRAAKIVPPTLNPKFVFQTFVVGPSNNFAHAATMAVAQSPGHAYNPLLIYGGVGLGKTHLMQAIGHHIFEKNKTSRVVYISAETLMNEYIDAIRNNDMVAFRRKYRKADTLLIDDIQFLSGKDRLQEEFFHTFNALFDARKQIVLTCDRPLSEIPQLEPRLVSRFEWGLVTQLELPDFETRTAILRHKEKQLGIELPDEVVKFIAEHIRSNIRSLEGSLIRVASFTSLTGRPLTLDALENLLRDSIEKDAPTTLSIESIQRAVADHFDIRLADMTSKRRPQSIAQPRQVAMFLCRSLTPHSLPMIGNAFGRNHATVIHACRTVTGRLKSDQHFRQSISSIRKKLGQEPLPTV